MFARLASAAILAALVPAATADLPKILITGFWPPTNEMIRPFSQSPVQNPGGWIGGNWEGRGYDIVSFFPEFPGGVGVNPKGNGDLEVDYQDTSNDFWQIVGNVKPLAIVTFSRGNAGSNWEIEAHHRKLPLNSWINDYLTPFKPTPELPIANEPDFQERKSSLPMEAIRDAVNAQVTGVPAFIDNTNLYAGNFVSEFMGYHGTWYKDLHSDPNDPLYTIAAGHIHVGISTPLDKAMQATQVTLREVINILPEPAGAILILCASLLVLRRR